jgi:hypothetical protein
LRIAHVFVVGGFVRSREVFALGESDTAASRLAVALATFGSACVLVAAAAILRPLADGTSVGAAVVSAALFIGAVVAASHFGADEQGDVPRAIADVFAAGSVLFLGSVAGTLADAAGASSDAATVVAAGVALPYSVFAQRRRPGVWVALATAVAAVSLVLGAIHLRSSVPSQAYAAGLLVVAGGCAVAAVQRVLLPVAVVEATSALAALGAAAALLGEDGGAGDVAVAVFLLLVVGVVAAGLRSASLVAALAAGSPLVVGLALDRTGYSWWSIPLAMAWTGAGCAVMAAYVQRDRAARQLGGVFAWCCALVVIADLFLANSTRLHALVAVVTAAAVFVAAATSTRRPVAVLAALTVLGALPRLVANAAVGRVVLLAVGVGLLYLALTATRLSERAREDMSRDV